MKFRFKHDDNESGDENPGGNCDDAQPITALVGTPTRKPTTVCPSPFYPGSTYVGTSAGESILIPFVAATNGNFTFYLRTLHSALLLEVLSPDKSTVLASDDPNNFDEGGDGFVPLIDNNDFGENNITQYTFPDAQTYWVRISNIDPPGDPFDFNLTISAGSGNITHILGDDTLTNYDQWRLIHVPGHNRLFALSSYGVSYFNPFPTLIEIPNMLTVFNATTSAQVGQSTAHVACPFSQGIGPVLFYNPHDDSVWVATNGPCGDGPGANSSMQRFHPDTGALLETIAIPPPGAQHIYSGIYVSQTNKIYGTQSGGANSNRFWIYDCTLRVYETPVIMPHNDGDGTYDVEAFAYDNARRQVAVVFVGPVPIVWLYNVDDATTATNTFSNTDQFNSGSRLPLYKDGLMYGYGGTFAGAGTPGYFMTLDFDGNLTRISGALFLTANKILDSGFDEFQQLYCFLLNCFGEGAATQLVRLDTDYNLVDSILIAKRTTDDIVDPVGPSWGQIVYNTETCSMAVLTLDQLSFVSTP